MKGKGTCIRCGSRTITVCEPNWLTGLASLYVNNAGSQEVMVVDMKATRKLLDALQVTLAKQIAIMAANENDRAANRAGAAKPSRRGAMPGRDSTARKTRPSESPATRGRTTADTKARRSREPIDTIATDRPRTAVATASSSSDARHDNDSTSGRDGV